MSHICDIGLCKKLPSHIVTLVSTNTLCVSRIVLKVLRQNLQSSVCNLMSYDMYMLDTSRFTCTSEQQCNMFYRHIFTNSKCDRFCSPHSLITPVSAQNLAAAKLLKSLAAAKYIAVIFFH